MGGDAAYCSIVHNLASKSLKLFPLKNADFDLLIPYDDSVDFFLFDTKGALPGGNGYGFDWTILNNYPYKNLSF